VRCQQPRMLRIALFAFAPTHLVSTFVAAARGDLLVRSRDWSLYATIIGTWAALGYTAATGCWMKAAAALQRRSVLPPRLEQTLLAALLVSCLLTLGMARASEATAGFWFAASTLVNVVAFPALLGLVTHALAATSRRAPTAPGTGDAPTLR